MDRHNFTCPCGCGFDTIDFELYEIFTWLEILFGTTTDDVDSGCRCDKYNASIVGSGSNSQHKYGRAMDLHCSPEVRDQIYKLLDNTGCYGLGLYDWGLHIDTRTNGPARWDRRTK